MGSLDSLLYVDHGDESATVCDQCSSVRIAKIGFLHFQTRVVDIYIYIYNIVYDIIDINHSEYVNFCILDKLLRVIYSFGCQNLFIVKYEKKIS